VTTPGKQTRERRRFLGHAPANSAIQAAAAVEHNAQVDTAVERQGRLSETRGNEPLKIWGRTSGPGSEFRIEKARLVLQAWLQGAAYGYRRACVEKIETLQSSGLQEDRALLGSNPSA
jgi:hypothetical protein